MSDAIRTRIALVRGRDSAVSRLHLGGRVTVALALALLAWFLCDWQLVTRLFGAGSWDIAARLALWIGGAMLVWRYALAALVRELKRRRSDDEMAMRLEYAFPVLGGRLISTVQLTRTLAAGDRQAVGSPGLVEALAEDTEQRVADLDARLAIPALPARKAVFAGVLALLAVAALAAWKPAFALTAAGRLAFLPWQYPTATRIAAVRVPHLVARGDPVLIEVEVDPTSDVPAQAWAVVRLGDGRTQEVKLERAGEAEGRPLYRGSLKQAIEDVSLRPRAGDARWSRWEDVTVQQRPAVRQLRLKLSFPAYLGKAATETSVGDLQVPVGTQVAVEAVFSRAVTTGSLVISVAGTDQAPQALTLGDQGGSGTGTFTVEADGTWTISLATSEGLTSGDPVRFTISAQPDRAPSVAVSFPPRDRDVTRFARWPVRWTARDDHGIAAGAIRYRIVPPGADPEAVTTEPGRVAIPEMTSDSAGAKTGESWFDLGQMPLEPGSRVLWWVEAADRRTPEANVGRSPQGVFNVLDPDEMLERMRREKADLLNTLKQLRDRQKEARDASDAVRKAGGGGK